MTLAIDTDAEFFAKFRSSKAAMDYVALLVGCEWLALPLPPGLRFDGAQCASCHDAATVPWLDLN